MRAMLAASPYLARCAAREPDALEETLASGSAQTLDDAIAALVAAGDEAEDIAAFDASLRRAKVRAHLGLAIDDLLARAPVDTVTERLSAVAEAAVNAAIRAHARLMAERGALPSALRTEEGVAGFAVLALGKLGSQTLNYSSDLDLIVLFDRVRFEHAGARDPQKAANRLLQGVVASLQDVTALGYGFRIDLRLRPDPGSTPPAVSTAAALRYYESLARTWERAAFIKARPLAGDRALGRAFLDQIAPFVWRRSLDFTVIDDLHAMKERMRRQGGDDPAGAPGSDLKRGRGGIRDIEFFVQAQQLVYGGRDPVLRTRATLDALAALSDEGRIARDRAGRLSEAYRLLRGLEHRAQMIADQQTHQIPPDREARATFAALCGHADLDAFDTGLAALMGEVEGLTEDVFQDDAVRPTAAPAAPRHAFADEAAVEATLSRWLAGRVPATRGERARALLERFAPTLLALARNTGAPDAAFTRFAQFFETLPAGAQVLSLLHAQPALAAKLIDILTLSPALSSELASRPDALDTFLDADFAAPLDTDAGRARERVALAAPDAMSFEETLNAARRHGREESFRIGVHVVSGWADAREAGLAHAALADAFIVRLSAAARADAARRAGDPGGELAVLGFGKLGGREMSAGSDVDLVTVYRAEPGTDAFFARTTQRLIAALSSPTEEGRLYEVDMQLRPSGRAGPIASRLEAFARYYREEAWVWELMALTRARVVCGPDALRAAIEAARLDALTAPRDPARINVAVCDMRRRIATERPARSVWDVKLAPGGLVDLEFIVQALQVRHARETPGVLATGTLDAIDALTGVGALSADDAAGLARAARTALTLTQFLRLGADGDFDPDTAPERLFKVMSDALGVEGRPALERELADVQAIGRAAFERLIGPV